MGEPLNPRYRLYHPKWHRTRIPIFWWLRSFAYIKFISRELTSLFVAYAGLLLLIEVSVLARGEAAYGRFLAWLQSPAVLALNAFVLLALLFHTFTWLNLAPRALVLRVGKRRVPDALVLAAHYSAWIAASALLAWLILRR